MTKARIYLLSIALGFSGHISSQKAYTFSDANEQGIRTSYLDSIYKSGIHVDTSQCVFKSDQDKYLACYRTMMKDLGKHLNRNGLSWDRQIQAFNLIYFDADGKIEYFLYKFRPGQITEDQEKEFGKHLQSFIQKYKFPMTANAKFRQCGQVTYALDDKGG